MLPGPEIVLGRLNLSLSRLAEPALELVSVCLDIWGGDDGDLAGWPLMTRKVLVLREPVLPVTDVTIECESSGVAARKLPAIADESANCEVLLHSSVVVWVVTGGA